MATKRVLILRCGVLILIASAAFTGLSVTSATAAGPQVYVIHSPIQPAFGQTVTYQATATDPNPITTSGITKIDIWEDQRQLQRCSNGQTQPPCSTSISAAWPKLLTTCTLASPQTVYTCTFTASYQSPTNYVGYRAVATNSLNQTGSDGYIYYAVGAYPFASAGGNLATTSDDPIPIYIPVGSAGGLANLPQKINLVFIPAAADPSSSDPSWMNYSYNGFQTDFMNDVTGLITSGYFSGAPFAQQTYGNRAMWNFYLTYDWGTAAQVQVGCPTLFPGPVNETNMATPTVNVSFTVHKTILTDCAKNPGTNSAAFSEEPTSYVPAMHETGHAAFLLSDEWCGGDIWQAKAGPPNAFNTTTDCRNLKCNSQNSCKTICPGGSTARCDGDTDLMKTTASVNDAFDQCDVARITWIYNTRCVTSCFPIPQ